MSIYLRVQDRLTHIQLLFTWNPSPLQSSRISLEYLLLPPRSAPMEAPTGPTPKVFNANHCDPLTRHHRPVIAQLHAAKHRLSL
ncbi:Subtilisin-like protease [Dirofilaria immitis]